MYTNYGVYTVGVNKEFQTNRFPHLGREYVTLPTANHYNDRYIVVTKQIVLHYTKLQSLLVGHLKSGLVSCRYSAWIDNTRLSFNHQPLHE